ncbi:hypothetical protein PoB_006835100 [Plakobranchus ocellatus]|uniref:Uncharacterized protein n=1 Tax=Plakobranchus ocellatus TaxID=259542 RepID=A0AAV4DCI5_9GAST|nr:hypothetical protein PoB_006835100 [Plakobranchus ocellatus]
MARVVGPADTGPPQPPLPPRFSRFMEPSPVRINLLKSFNFFQEVTDGLGMNYKETSSHLSGPRDEKRKIGTLVTIGKFEGKRSTGRQREKIMDGLATWLGPGKVSDIGLLAAVKDRDLWRDMIANAYKQGT